MPQNLHQHLKITKTILYKNKIDIKDLINMFPNQIKIMERNKTWEILNFNNTLNFNSKRFLFQKGFPVICR